eukprot:SAG31_NODE_530_length_14420_cov_4.259968_2_plen_77_part_00
MFSTTEVRQSTCLDTDCAGFGAQELVINYNRDFWSIGNRIVGVGQPGDAQFRPCGSSAPLEHYPPTVRCATLAQNF